MRSEFYLWKFDCRNRHCFITLADWHNIAAVFMLSFMLSEVNITTATPMFDSSSLCKPGAFRWFSIEPPQVYEFSFMSAPTAEDLKPDTVNAVGKTKGVKSSQIRSSESARSFTQDSSFPTLYNLRSV